MRLKCNFSELCMLKMLSCMRVLHLLCHRPLNHQPRVLSFEVPQWSFEIFCFYFPDKKYEQHPKLFFPHLLHLPIMKWYITLYNVIPAQPPSKWKWHRQIANLYGNNTKVYPCTMLRWTWKLISYPLWFYKLDSAHCWYILIRQAGSTLEGFCFLCLCQLHIMCLKVYI